MYKSYKRRIRKLSLGNSIRYLLKLYGWTLDDLSRESGIPRSTLEKLGVPGRKNRLWVLLKVANTFGVEVSDLISPKKKISKRILLEIKSFTVSGKIIRLRRFQGWNRKLLSHLSKVKIETLSAIERGITGNLANKLCVNLPGHWGFPVSSLSLRRN